MHVQLTIFYSFPRKRLVGVKNSSNLNPRGGASKWRCTSYDLGGKNYTGTEP